MRQATQKNRILHDSDSVDTDSISIMDNVDNPPNTDDSSYGDTIAGVKYHEEEPHHE